MQQEKYPYRVWPGMSAVAVLIGSGVLLKQISQQPEEPVRGVDLQRTDPQRQIRSR
ncbi:hypothetical protein ABID21_001959 [Pseudorhizobium tarimense]|uniref:Uncharacterized protein n=1 Tax=Pseudorhizobium tarimense TaxID=1079109 RepID=A0ABV2H5M7_9HYPH